MGRKKSSDRERLARTIVPHLPRHRIKGRRNLGSPTSARTVRRQVTKTRITVENNVKAITSNAFIEFDMRRAFVPKIVVSKKAK